MGGGPEEGFGGAEEVGRGGGAVEGILEGVLSFSFFCSSLSRPLKEEQDFEEATERGEEREEGGEEGGALFFNGEEEKEGEEEPPERGKFPVGEEEKFGEEAEGEGGEEEGASPLINVESGEPLPPSPLGIATGILLPTVLFLSTVLAFLSLLPPVAVYFFKFPLTETLSL